MRRLIDIEPALKATLPERVKRYAEEKNNILGHVVELPLHFLEEENLEIQLTEKEIILPDFFFS